MREQVATSTLRLLELGRVAPRGEEAVDVEQAPLAGGPAPEPVLLLTDAALYARAHDQRWVRLPLQRIRQVSVRIDATGMLTRYGVVDDTGALWCDVALPLARDSFRDRMSHLAARHAAPVEAGCGTGWPVLAA